jgi:leucine dehydrogenase
LINAGGIINVYAELAHYDREEIMRRTENIYNTTLEILVCCRKGITTHHVALNIAQTD